MISKLIIDNFRCFKNTEFNFTQLGILVGGNGTGKTSILEAINFATSKDYASRKIDEQDFCAENSLPIKIEVYFDKYFISQIKDGYATKNIVCNGVILRVKRRDRSSPGKALSDGVTIEHLVTPVEYASVSELNEEKFPQGYDKSSIPSKLVKTSEGYQAPRSTGNSTWEIASQNLQLNGDLVGYPTVFYFDRNRELEAKTGYNSLFQKIIKEFNWRYLKEANPEEAIKLWEPYYQSVIGLVDNSKRKTILDPLRADMQSILGQDYSELEISLLNVKQPFLQSFFSLRSEGEMSQIEFSGLGSGVSTIIAYLLLKVISQLSKQEIIFLIDEPEMHLHSQAQYNLFSQFIDATHQIIFTTHSDHFISLKHWEGIVRFSSAHDIFPKQETLAQQIDGKAISDHLDEIRKWHQDETIYFRENNEIFFSKKILLVEGPLEKYGIPRLAKIAGYDLGNTTIVSCNGVSKIPYYQLLCKAYEIPYFTLFDQDEKPPSDVERKRIRDWADAGNVQAFDASFEESLSTNIEKEAHKGSNTLAIIDSIKLEEISEEIKSTLKIISEWSFQ